MFLPSCDGGAEETVLDVVGAWESDVFVHEDAGGTPVGNAVLEVSLEQDGGRLEGAGELHLLQARFDLPFEVDGSVGERTVAFTMVYDTAPAESANCTTSSEDLLKCLKGSVRFNLNRFDL